MTLGQRLEKVERENRWMRRIGAVGVAVAAAVFLVGQGKDEEPPDLVVRSLKVVDNKGMAHARISHHKGRGVLMLWDRETRSESRLSSEGLMFIGAEGPRSALGGSLRLFDDMGTRALLDVGEGGPFLELRDEKSNVRAVLGVTTAVDRKTGAETTLTLYDAKGKVIWQAPKD